jgi:hypothetical protein
MNPKAQRGDTLRSLKHGFCKVAQASSLHPFGKVRVQLYDGGHLVWLPVAEFESLQRQDGTPLISLK